jgi:2-keto-4-pentenoate hydratase/2-oxohepta-3-ene-1,7-dioic acid hydratase in catechol pathway
MKWTTSASWPSSSASRPQRQQGDALDYVLGYTCANDVSARDWQIKRGGGQWCRGKTFDTFCSAWSLCWCSRTRSPNPNTLCIKTILNGKTMQDWNTNDMIFDVPTLIEFLSGSTTLLPGTVITYWHSSRRRHGTQAPCLPPTRIDTVTIEIEKIGALTNPVRPDRNQPSPGDPQNRE